MDKINDKTYIPLTPFKGWVIENFPFIEADFDAITNYELICLVVKYLNNIIANQNAVEDLGSELVQGYNDLVDYVNNYFDNLDVQEEVDHKLDEMVTDGTLTNIISAYVNPYLSDMSNQISIMNLKIDSVVNGNPIPVTSVDDMTDEEKIYVLTTDGYWYYYDGTEFVQGGVYQSAVNSDDLANELNIVGYKLITGYYLNSAGIVTAVGSGTRCITDKIPVVAGSTVLVKGESNSSSVSFCTFYDEKNQPLATNINAGSTGEYYSCVAPSGTAYFRVSSKTDITTAIAIDGKSIMNNKIVENILNLNNNIYTTNQLVKDLTNGMSLNLYDSTKSIEHSALNQTTGLATTTAGNYFVSDFIPVIVGKTLYIKAGTINYAFRRIACYDENFGYMSATYSSSATSYLIPNGAKYIRFDASLTYKDNICVSYDQANDYVPYGYIAKNELVLYVAKTGDDTNTGNIDSPLLTIGKALEKNPTKIVISAGTYEEKVNINKDIIIVGNGNVVISSSSGNVLNADGKHVELYNLKVTGSATNNIYLINCTGKLVNVQSYNAGSNGFRLDGSSLDLINCIANENGNDGFGAHDTANNVSVASFINCKAYGNTDDGLSYHEEGIIYVNGGEYYDNGSGITPFGHCTATVENCLIKDNTIGLNCFNTVDTTAGYCKSFNNLIIDNTYPYKAQYYSILTVNDVLYGNTNDPLIDNGNIDSYPKSS